MDQPRFIVDRFTAADYMTLTGHAFVWLAIWAVLSSQVELAVCLLMVAMILDGLDGKVARALGIARPFGQYLGSFVDFSNYVVCPPLVLWAIGYRSWGGRLVLLVYSTAALVRLSRFNEVGNIKDDQGRLAYLGLPVFWIHPVAAALYMLNRFGRPELFHLATPVALLTLSVCFVLNRPFWKPKSSVAIVAIPASTLAVFAWLTLHRVMP